MLNQALEHSWWDKSEERGLGLLRRWNEDHATIWAYFATHDGGVGSSMVGQITEVTRCLVFKNESSVLRFDLKNARFRYGPLQVLLMPLSVGRAAVVTQKRMGLMSKDGVLIVLESGHSLFVCESTGSGAEWLELAVGGLAPAGLLGP